LKIYVLHGSVAMQLERGVIYNNNIFANCLQSAPVKKKLKTGQLLAKILTKVKCHVFYDPRCTH